jgi:Protein of unknown function (DUF3078)
MFQKLLILTIACTLSLTLSAQKVLEAKDAIKEMAANKDAKDGWTKAGGIGLNMNLLSLINPRVGAGDNQIGIGGILNYGANLLRGKLLWDTKFLVQLATIKAAGDAWTKATDVLQATTQVGHQISADGKWYIAGLGDIQTQLLPTYGTNFLKDQSTSTKKTILSGKLFAPLTLKLAPGVIYKPNADVRILYSPFAYKGIFVGDDVIAKQGNFIPLPTPTTFKKVDHQIGSELRIDYTKKFLEGKIVYTSTLDLYSNYLRTPQNIDVEWYNSFDVGVSKNISLNFRTDWFYDHDIQVFKGGDVNAKGRAAFGRNALLLKYNTIF